MSELVKQLRGDDENHVPVVFAKGGAIFANSRDVAACFGKDHFHVLRDIDNLLKSLAIQNWMTDASFHEASFTDETQPGRTFRSFDMSRDGFTLLAMGSPERRLSSGSSVTSRRSTRWKRS